MIQHDIFWKIRELINEIGSIGLGVKISESRAIRREKMQMLITRYAPCGRFARIARFARILGLAFLTMARASQTTKPPLIFTMVAKARTMLW